MKLQKLIISNVRPTAAWALAAAALVAATVALTPKAAFAQGSKTIQMVDNYCPWGFSKKNSQCVGQDDWVGFYKGRSGSCPANWRSSRDYCVYSANDKARDATADTNMKNGDWTFARLPLLQRVAKAAETDFCPTGYFTHRTDLKLCVTHYKDAPKSRQASGGKCGAGETLERGQYCTGPTTMPAAQMDGAMTADFNELYTGYGIKHGGVRNFDQRPPELAAPLLAQYQAEKDAERAKQDAVNAEATRKAEAEVTGLNNHRNEQQRIACEAGRPNFPNGYPSGHPCNDLAASSGAAGASGEGVAGAGKDAVKKEAAKEVGKALKGLLGR